MIRGSNGGWGTSDDGVISVIGVIRRVERWEIAWRKRQAQLQTYNKPFNPDYERHEHPIRWDIDQQLWVCSKGCGYTRERREQEKCYTREQAALHRPMVTKYDRASGVYMFPKR